MSDPNADIAKVLVSEREIQRRVRELAARVQSDFAGRDLVVVGLLTGTLMFLADLVREIDLPLRLDFIGVSSYRDGTKSRELIFTKELRLDVAGRDVLLVDDILDTGKTLRGVIDKLDGMTPRQIRTCVLLSKKHDANTTSLPTTSASKSRTSSSSATASTTRKNTATCPTSAC